MSTPTQPVEQTAAPAMFADVKALWDAAGKVQFLASLPTLSIPAIASRLLEPPIETWKVFAQTWPLSLSVAVAGVGWFRGAGRPVESFVTLSLGLGVTSWLGGWLGLPNVVPIEWWKLLLWPLFVVLSPGTVGRLLDAYYAAYGPVRFFSSIAIGALLAWFWGSRILPRFDGRVVVAQADRERVAAALREIDARRTAERARVEPRDPPGRGAS